MSGPSDLPVRNGSADFDPEVREAELVAQAAAWDTSAPVQAAPGDIPTVDLKQGPQAAAAAMRHACEQVGFFQIIGHGVPPDEVASIFEQARRFHALPVDVRQTINIDNPDHPLGGVGYLPMGERRLPRRDVGNRNEAFLLKRDAAIAMDDNQWLSDDALPGFRSGVERFAELAEDLALRLVRVYALALDLPEDWFEEAFADPFWRLRLTHYPSEPPRQDGSHGIAPHVDTTFFTLLWQDGPGLHIHHAPTDRWISVPQHPDAIVVNTGELLRQWSNDRFLSTRHFADNRLDRSRYSIPLFFNASGDWPMECLPTCTTPGNPPKYPTISYNQSQAVAQGE